MWTRTLSFIEVAQKLLDLQLKAERVMLLQHVKNAEKQLEARGLPTTAIKTLTKAIEQTAPVKSQHAIDRDLLSPKKPRGVWRKTYLAVKTKPGSVF